METLYELRRSTDQALVEFTVIKTELREKLKITDELKANIEAKIQSYRNMVVGMSYEFMKAHEMDIEIIELDRKKLEKQLVYHEKDVDDMNTKCLLAENRLTNARREEYEFLSTLL
jgi:hypothetical protein